MNFDKKAVVLDLLRDNMIHLYCLSQRVRGLPDSVRARYVDTVVLHVGYDLPVPIVDLVIDEEGIAGVFSFNRTPTRLYIPWNAVTVAAIDGEGAISWPYKEDAPAQDMPSDAELVKNADAARAIVRRAIAKIEGTSHLKVIK